MKNLTSTAGWLLLAAVLAVPSFLVYNWWAKNREKAVLDRAQEMNSGAVFQPLTAPGRIAPPPASGPEGSAKVGQAGGGVTAPEAEAGNSPVPQTSKKTEPEAGSDAGRGQGGKPVSQQTSKLREEAAFSAPAQSAPAMAPGISAPSKISAQAVFSSAAASMPADVSTRPALTSYFSPKSQRDPTTSPTEYQRIKQEEYQRAETERRKLAAERKRERETGIASKMRFQGVVGNSIIINDEMYNIGQKIFGATILKVGTDYFIGEYKGKKFKKVLR